MSAQATKVVQLLPVTGQASEKKWGKSVIEHGFSIFPSLIFRAQARLGLSPAQLAVLMQLADYWWSKDRLPCPSKATLATRLGLSERQVQRYLAELEKAGYLKRKERFKKHNGQTSNEYDLGGLVKKLKEIEPDFREAKAQAVQATRKGGLAVLKTQSSVVARENSGL